MARLPRRDDYTVVQLKKSLEVRQSSVSLTNAIADDCEQNHGYAVLMSQGLEGIHGPRASATPSNRRVIDYLLTEMPWIHATDDPPAEVSRAMGEALSEAKESLMESTEGDPLADDAALTLALLHGNDLYFRQLGPGHAKLVRDGHVSDLSGDAGLHGGLPAFLHPPMSSWIPWRSSKAASPPSNFEHRELVPGDVLLLMSAGVWDEQSDQDLIELTARESNAEAICESLVPRRGAHDRTALVVRIPRRSPVPVSLGSVPLRHQHEALAPPRRRVGAGDDGRPVRARPDRTPRPRTA